MKSAPSRRAAIAAPSLADDVAHPFDPLAEPLELDVALVEDTAGIVARPDGYHWVSEDGQCEFGPFSSLEDALADRDAAADEDRAPEPGMALREAEDEFGIADWIDPETGAPAEGHCPPHLDTD